MKTTLFAVLFLTLVYSSYGQLRYGLSAGVNSSANYGKGYFENERRTGAHIGVKLQYQLLENLNIETVIAYAQKGSVNKNTFYDPDSGIRSLSSANYLNLNYIDFPLLISPLLNLNCIKLYPMVGLDQGILIQATNKVPRYDDATSNTNMHRVNLFNQEQHPSLVYENAQINRYHMGLIGGLGMQFKVFSKQAAFLEAKYAYGLSPVLTTATGVEVKNTVLTFTMGILF